MKPREGFYDPSSYRAYKGPPDPLVETFVRELRNEEPDKAAETVLSVPLTDGQLVAAALFQEKIDPDKPLRLALISFYVSLRPGTIVNMPPSLGLELAGHMYESKSRLNFARSLEGRDEYCDYALIAALIRWKRFDEALTRIASLERSKHSGELALLEATLRIAEGRYRDVIEILGGIRDEPEAILLRAYAAYGLCDNALLGSYIPEIESVPRTYRLRWMSLVRANKSQHRYVRSVQNLLEGRPWTVCSRRIKDGLAELLKERTVAP